MSYRLEDLGPQEFEHLVQALLMRIYGPTVSVFGAGPDSGRDGVFEGRAVPADEAARAASQWDGYHVFQAKFHERPTNAQMDKRWLLSQIRQELDRWVNPTSGRKGRKPEYIVFVTNVALSGVVGGGIDQAKDAIRTAAASHDWDLKDCAVWDRAKVSRLLDAYADVRQRFNGLITSGDVLAVVRQQSESGASDSYKAALPLLEEHARTELLARRKVSLGEAGDTANSKLDLTQVAVDLPARFDDDQDPLASFSALRRIVHAGESVMRPSITGGDHRHYLLMGGPGQGKTTLGRLLVQIYRASLLADVASLPPDVQTAVTATLASAARLGIRRPTQRRWPIRVDLAEYADPSAGGAGVPLIEYIATQVSRTTGGTFHGRDMRKWLGAWPWLIVLDGYDEVAAQLVRERVATAVEALLQAATTEDADLLIVATTRPQGYGDELPLALRKVRLLDLPRKTAIGYATKLIDLRLGNDADKGAVLQRVAEAVDNEITGRLMRTPLQVMIMSLLLDRRRKLPQDRADLFGSYYEIVYDREVQKGNYLAEMLRTYRPDIDAIHATVGLRLQAASEDASAPDAALDRDELQAIIEQRLVDQEHDSGNLRRLTGDLLKAAQNRLVLLEAKGKDQVGFELRSLQEFMAAKAIAGGLDDEVLRQLRAMAPSAHWRNTWLLAVGTVYRARPPLFERVLHMMRELDAEDPFSFIMATGPLLCIEILQDGVAATSPKHVRLLTDHALDLLKGPNLGAGKLGEAITDLGPAGSAVQLQIVAALQAAWDGSPDAHHAAATVLGELGSRDQTGPLAARVRQLKSSETKAPLPAGPDPVGKQVRLADALPESARHWDKDSPAGRFYQDLRRIKTTVAQHGAYEIPAGLTVLGSATAVALDEGALLQVSDAIREIPRHNWSARAAVVALLWIARQRLPIAAALGLRRSGTSRS
jgi:hypothetical protein